MDKDKAVWCRKFSELLLASGKWQDVGVVVWLAQVVYPSVCMLSPEQAVWVLKDICDSQGEGETPFQP